MIILNNQTILFLVPLNTNCILSVLAFLVFLSNYLNFLHPAHWCPGISEPAKYVTILPSAAFSWTRSFLLPSLDAYCFLMEQAALLSFLGEMLLQECLLATWARGPELRYRQLHKNPGLTPVLWVLGCGGWGWVHTERQRQEDHWGLMDAV